ncbi:MAG: NAD-binding protein [Candidatus Eisenbacteria bacterium]|jgi:trk system potassium uptake protein TrkA|nr:NAD-binding protein [Candidatus Eisenbacteria bacterium]
MKNKDANLVIVGCGRLGSYLANRLSREGYSVVVIDRSSQTFDNLTPAFSGFKVEGDATQISVLNAAKLKAAEVLIATTHDDNVNLWVAQVARTIFGVARVLARVFDPRREQIYAELGIQTICPTSVAAELFIQAVLGDGNAKGPVI